MVTNEMNPPAVDDLWGCALKPQGIGERDRSVQKPLLFRLILVDQKTINITLPVADVLAVKGVVLICGVGVADGSFDTLQGTYKFK